MNRDPDLVWDASEHSHPEEAGDSYVWLADQLTEFIKEVNSGGEWYVVIENFGWQSRNLHGEFDAGDGMKLLQEVLPNTPCTFKVWLDKEEKKITFNNAHHDKPTGGEMYYVTPRGE